MIALAVGFLSLASPQDPPVNVWDRLEFYATGRMRGEATWDQPNDANDRYRGRMRFRLGTKYQLTEELKAEARLSTTSDGHDANNPHWDFGDGDGFNGADVALDRFFLDWMAMEELDVRVGKQPHAFKQPPIYGEFLWDNDIQPSGAAALWTPETDGDATFDVRAAGYVATEVADDADPKMLGVQGNVVVPVEDELTVNATASLYDWDDLEDGVTVAGNQGNTDVTSDFTILEGILSGTMKEGPLDEMTGYVQLMHNLAQDDEENGFALGGQLGPASGEQGQYNFFLVYYDLDADCVFSPVAQDDTPIAGTGDNGDPEGMNGFVVGGTYFWRDNMTFKVWLLTSDADVDEDPFRLRIDFDFTLDKKHL